MLRPRKDVPPTTRESGPSQEAQVARALPSAPSATADSRRLLLRKSGAARPRAASKKVFAREDLHIFCGERSVHGRLGVPGGRAPRRPVPAADINWPKRFCASAWGAREEVAAAVARAPCVVFEMHLEGGASYEVSLFFCLFLAPSIGVFPTASGALEQARQTWRPLPEVVENICRTRRPAQAGVAYARALEEVLQIAQTARRRRLGSGHHSCGVRVETRESQGQREDPDMGATDLDVATRALGEAVIASTSVCAQVLTTSRPPLSPTPRCPCASGGVAAS